MSGVHLSWVLVVILQEEEAKDPWEWWLGFVVVLGYAILSAMRYFREQREERAARTWDATQAKMMQEQYERASESGKRFVRKPRSIDPAEERVRGKISVNMRRFFRRPCPHCGIQMSRQDVLAACVDCDMASHWMCARKHGGCTTEGCNSLVYLHPWRIIARWKEIDIDASRYAGSTCPVCDGIVLAEDDVAICLNCDYAYHEKCAPRASCIKRKCRSLVYLHPSGRLRTWRQIAVTWGPGV